MAPRSDEYIGLDLTLIGYRETSAMCTSGVMRLVRDDTIALG